MKILSAGEMREVDRLTTERHGIAGLTLMENAATRTVEAATRKFGSFDGKRALVICGRGNNGGDGAAIARLIHGAGAWVRCILVGKVSDTRGDARVNFERAAGLSSDQRFKFIEAEDANLLRKEAASYSPDVCFDALFGTGLSRPAAGIFKDAIDVINEVGSAAPVVSVDVPSGVASDSAALIGPTVRARLTVTFTAPKIASLLPPASDHGGELVVASIGSPSGLINESGSQLNLIDREMVAEWLASSRRGPHAHKGDVGKVLIVAGARGKTGAACLAGGAAMRAGCGLVTVATPASSQSVLASQVMAECMTESLEETASGSVSRKAVERALELAAERDVVAIGPGIGSSDESTREFVRTVVERRKRPLILDADGLNSLAPWPESWRASVELPMILTPHPGEMARLAGTTIKEVTDHRIEVARNFAGARSLILVLKGSPTVIASPEGQIFVNPTGNSGMASGGTGDVLTGIVASLLAQKPSDPLGATVAGVYLHGLAGDIAASLVGIRAMVASDIIEHLGDAFAQAGGQEERLTREIE